MTRRLDYWDTVLPTRRTTPAKATLGTRITLRLVPVVLVLVAVVLALTVAAIAFGWHS